jgi:hypothetical protein
MATERVQPEDPFLVLNSEDADVGDGHEFFGPLHGSDVRRF